MDKRTEAKIRENRSKLFDEKGMTLIDVAIALMVIGLLITPIFYQLREYKSTHAKKVTEDNIKIVSDAIDRYYIENDFYPCPANPTLSRGNPNHGVAATAGASNNCTFNSSAGAVPHAELNLNIENTYDGWGNKLAYAVSDNLAGKIGGTSPIPGGPGIIQLEEIPIVLHPVTFAGVCADTLLVYPPSPMPIGLSLNDYPPTPVIKTNIHYTVLSYGPNAKGAFTETAGPTPMQACTAGSSADTVNCNADLTFVSGQCRNRDANNVNYFDDIFMKGAIDKDKEPTRMFERSDLSATGAGATANFIGIRNNDPQHELDITGNLKVTDTPLDPTDAIEGAARADDYCSEDGTLCFQSTLIGGSVLTTPCPPGEVMVGIANNSADCKPQFTNTATGNCSAMGGVGAISGGVVTCIP